jgi:hypothetical protein
MSNRAEEFARKLYTPWSEDGMSRKDNTEVIEACIKGYEQAEKDNELTWEDMLKISELLEDVRYEFRNAGSYDDIPWYTGDGKSKYEEVLKRFNEQRKK